MSYYTFNPDFSYADYLKAGNFARQNADGSISIIWEVPAASLNLVADEASLQVRNIKISNRFQKDGTDWLKLEFLPEEPVESFPDMPVYFHWGLADKLSRLGHMNEGLGVLTLNTDSPEQTLAFNHFDKARNAFIHKDYPLAFMETEIAINGDQTSSGFRSEWRFYMLLGIMRLGFYGCDLGHVDLELAEEAFVNAALFARTEYPVSCAIAYLAASWAAYCQGKNDKAVEHAGKALENNPALAEANFLLARYKIDEPVREQAMQHLSDTVNANTFYALKAVTDEKFQQFQADLNFALGRLRHDRFEMFKARIYNDMNILSAQAVPADIKGVIDRFSQEKSLLEVSKSEKEWDEFKVRPVFICKELEQMHVDHESILRVVEPYNEKVIIKPATWYRKEESKLVTKNRVVERKKKMRYEVRMFRDAFMFFTGKVLVDYNMALAEGGKYKMGDTLGVGRIDEKPIQDVELSSFLISAHLVTQKLWNLVMDSNPSNFHGYDLPVEHVSWYDSVEFCNKLSAVAGFEPVYEIRANEPDPLNLNKTDNVKWTVICHWERSGYRLPTEAEWEFAAKGGNSSNHYKFSGSDDVGSCCWYKDNSQYKTHPVGQKPHNELGLYDMSGNVWEWVWDWYDPYKEEAFVDPHGPETGSYRVLRGGSWADNPNYQRAAGRGKENPTGRYTSIGLRIVRRYNPPQESQ